MSALKPEQEQPLPVQVAGPHALQVEPPEHATK